MPRRTRLGERWGPRESEARGQAGLQCSSAIPTGAGVIASGQGNTTRCSERPVTSACGTTAKFHTNGLYTAPRTAGDYTVTSKADESKSASASVRVDVVSVAVEPATVRLLPGQQQRFTATAGTYDDLLPDDPRIALLRPTGKATIGAKRNLACGTACCCTCPRGNSGAAGASCGSGCSSPA